MKGIVFNLLEGVVAKHYGDDIWDDIVDCADVSGTYTSLGNYSDDEIGKLVTAASELLAIPPADVLRWFGRAAMPLLAEKYPELFSPFSSSRPFILSVNKFIHPEVRKLYAGADCPYFHFTAGEADDLEMSYRSARKLCALAEGFAHGAADHYKERLSFRHVECMHHGDSKCHFRLGWAEKPTIECLAA